jgi:hypothetical protein
MNGTQHLDNIIPVRKQLPGEMRQAVANLTKDDLDRLQDLGVPWLQISAFQMVGTAMISRIIDTPFYELDPTGVRAFITPVLRQLPDSFESVDPAVFCRSGKVVELVAWMPHWPQYLQVRLGGAECLGLVPPQYLDPDPVTIRRNPLDWLIAGCDGVVILPDIENTNRHIIDQFRGGVIFDKKGK